MPFHVLLMISCIIATFSIVSNLNGIHVYLNDNQTSNVNAIYKQLGQIYPFYIPI